MSGINASRERIDIVRNHWMTEDEGTRSKTTIRGNRMILPLRNRDGDEKTVIRGKTLVSTLRMGMAVMDAFRNYGTVSSEGAIYRYSEDWKKSLSQYDKMFMKDGNWIAVYVNGVPTFCTSEVKDLDRIEAVASGGTVSEGMLDAQADNFADGGEEVHFMYDSQLAVTLSSQEKFVKCAVLERNLVNEGTLSFQYVRKPKARGTVIETVNLAVNIIEASTLARQYHGMRKKLPKLANGEAKAAIASMEVMKSRVSELNTAIKLCLTQNQVQFWPEEPRFILN